MKVRNLRLALILAISASLTYAQEKECDASIAANANCVITINRESPTSPLPVTMGRATAKVRVLKRPLDQVAFAATSTQAALPDPVAAIFNAFSPSLKAVTLSLVTSTGQRVPVVAGTRFLAFDGGVSADPIAKVKNEIAWIASQQQTLKPVLDDLKKALDDTAADIKALQSLPAGTWQRAEVLLMRNRLICKIAAGGGASPTTIDQTYACGFARPGVGVRLPPLGVTSGLHEAVTTATASGLRQHRAGRDVDAARGGAGVAEAL